MDIAVLGCGSIGHRHLRNLQASGGHELTAFDPIAAGRDAAAQLGAQAFDSLDDIWKAAPEVAFVTAPTNQHAPLAKAAAEHGCHLFIEKPLHHDQAGAKAIVDAVKKAGVQAMVACNMRYHPGPATIHDRLAASAIGDVLSARIHCGSYLPRWRPHQDHTQSYSADPFHGGAILDVIHELDLAQWLLGPATFRHAEVQSGTSIGVETDALAEILLRHGSAISSVHLDFVQRDPQRGIQIIGTEGSLHWDYGRGTVQEIGAEGELVASHAQPPDWQDNDMYVEEIRDFLGCLAADTVPPNGVAEAAATLDVALQARAAWRPEVAA